MMSAFGVEHGVFSKSTKGAKIFVNHGAKMSVSLNHELTPTNGARRIWRASDKKTRGKGLPQSMIKEGTQSMDYRPVQNTKYVQYKGHTLGDDTDTVFVRRNGKSQ